MEEKEMPFWEHFNELRRRLILCIVVFIIITIVSFPLSPIVISRIMNDLVHDARIIVLSPQEAIIVYLNLSILLSFILSFPIVAYHLWVFIAPGLLDSEKRIILPVIVSSILLFITGIAFSYYLLLPLTIRFLINVSYSVAEPFLDLRQTISFITGIMLIFGLLFQLPLVAAVLSRLSILNHKSLKSRRNYFILIAFILSAIITDPSIFTQILVAIPIIILYEISVLAARMFERK
ncbi:MAG TPA: twin-arginine translocase subunit TatC [Candidatus Altiarchaeales archaeon]|nr:twin-arginine translocase subunit TatC [Candidatus Altiarchaeales archaeon]